jgi:hypothetical protein
MGGFFGGGAPAPPPAPKPTPKPKPETRAGRQRRLAKQRHQRGGITEEGLFIISKLGKPVPAQNVEKPTLG